MFIAHVSIKLTLLKTCIAQIKTCIIIKNHTQQIYKFTANYPYCHLLYHIRVKVHQFFLSHSQKTEERGEWDCGFKTQRVRV